MDTIKVGIVGYGVIGKRVADAVAAQPDMEVAGIADIIADARMEIAKKRGFPIYCSIPDFREKMEHAGFDIQGYLEDLVQESDVIVDCTPAGIPQRNFPLYEKYHKKIIVQGGEKHHIVQASFSTFANYVDCLGLDKIRVVSCNTTGIARVLAPLMAENQVKDVFVALARRAADPVRTNRGPINGVVPVLGISHHGPDVVTVYPELAEKIYSLAVAASFTLSHVHMIKITVEKPMSRDELIELWKKYPRIIVRRGKEGLHDTAQLVEYYRDLGRPRYDRPEVFIWEETIDSDSRGNIYLIYDVHMESIPIPENIDAIRAIFGTADIHKTIEITDRALHIDDSKYDYSVPFPGEKKRQS